LVEKSIIDGLIANPSEGLNVELKRWLEKGKPEWDLLGLPNVADLPAVKWRQLNLDKLSSEKRVKLVAELEKVLSK
jgi:hypothetical protein